MTAGVGLRCFDSDRKTWASIRSFVGVPAGAASLEFENSKAGASDVLLAFDHQPVYCQILSSSYSTPFCAKDRKAFFAIV